MTKERTWPVRAIYILIAAALAMSLILTGAFTGKLSANPGLSEWTRVDTPTIADWLLAPESDIIDFAIADGGAVAYAIVFAFDDACNVTTGLFTDRHTRLLKSEDGAATWEDITDDDWAGYQLLKVATDGVDADFVAVALWTGSAVEVYISDDGGTTFDEVSGTFAFNFAANVYELEVSPEVAGERDLAIGGTDGGTALLYRSPETGGFEDATNLADYPGWQADFAVVDIKFAPSWAADWTVLVATADATSVLLQFGSWGTSEGWNLNSILGIAYVTVAGPATVPPVSSVPWTSLKGLTAGITLPLDYAGRNPDKRYAWVNVNYFEAGAVAVGKIFRVKNKSVLEVNQQIEGKPWLTNVYYDGYIAEGRAIAGLLGDGTAAFVSGCAGVQVYRNTQITNMDICCLPWEEACKPPTGVYAMEAFFVSADKVYAVALGGYPYDEAAWSVSFDEGDTFNQLSLVDTYIDYFSDVAVSPDCNKTWVVSVNNGERQGYACDSVWLYADDLPEAEEYSDHWLRVWCGDLEYDWGFLRLNPEETTGDTVYLVDYDTSTVYWNELEGLACWDRGSAPIDHIVDLAVLDAETIFALGDDGNVAMSDDFAIGWYEEVDSEVAPGYTIAVWGDNVTPIVLVGSEDGEVSYADTSEAEDWEDVTFTALEDVPNGYYVTVAFDTYFDTNDVIYAATAGFSDNGIYRWVIGESESWMDLKAEPLESQIGIYDADSVDESVEVNFTGIVVDRPGNPYTSADNGGVIYASYYGTLNVTGFTGVARSLERTVEICTTCLTWDFLHVGLGLETDKEDFEATPDALKICGCLTPDSNTNLFALDDGYPDYDMCDGTDGALWTYEDCYAKKAPAITYPDEGIVVPADPCSCYSAPFTVTWDSLCDACSYDIQFAKDEDFNMVVQVNGKDTDYHIIGDVPSFSVLGGPEGGLSCETTYYVRVRAADAATGEIIHSWWSVPLSFTIAPSIEAAQITLVAPAPGATGVAVKNLGFSWNLLASADAFDWVLSPNADLSSPADSKTGLTGKATTYTGSLDYGTTYYWKVTAYNEGAPVSVSAIGTFTTAAQGAFCCPQDGLCFATQAELQTHINAQHPAQPATPIWVWIVIAIGAVLVIVVIVLIFRTRRV